MTTESKQNSPASPDRMKVFVSYSRVDVDFTDQLVLALEDKGFETILDRHDIDAGENWQERLSALLHSSDTIVFVLTPTSAASPICLWEAKKAGALGKRMFVVVPAPLGDVTPPEALANLQWIRFHQDPAIPGSGVIDGLLKLARALRVDLTWLREQTRLSEQAARWERKAKPEDELLRGAQLLEALEWLNRKPSGATILEALRTFLNASQDAEAVRRRIAESQIAEREEALQLKAAALEAKAKTDQLRRILSVSAIAAGVVLILSLGLGYSAINTTAQLQKAKSRELGRSAQQLLARNEPIAALVAVLAGDPAATEKWETQLVMAEGVPESLATLDKVLAALEVNAAGSPSERVNLGCAFLQARGVTSFPDKFLVEYPAIPPDPLRVCR